MGSARGKEVREGQAPKEWGRCNSQQGRGKHGEGRRRKGGSGVMKKSQRAQSDHFSRRLFVAV
jgi:hypothetical protein